VNRSNDKVKIEARSRRNILFLILGTVLLVSFGTIAIGLSLVDTLQDNSKKMRVYAVKPNNQLVKLDNDLTDNFLDKTNISDAARAESDRLSNQAGKLARRSDYGHALKLCQASLDLLLKDMNGKPTGLDNIKVASRYNMLSSYYAGLGDFDRALICISKSIELAPNEPFPYSYRASIYKHLHNQALAQRDLKRYEAVKADEINPKEFIGDVARQLIDHPGDDGSASTASHQGRSALPLDHP
jgi:tetratricopeptide (TPR) repeat protein